MWPRLPPLMLQFQVYYRSETLARPTIPLRGRKWNLANPVTNHLSPLGSHDRLWGIHVMAIWGEIEEILLPPCLLVSKDKNCSLRFRWHMRDFGTTVTQPRAHRGAALKNLGPRPTEHFSISALLNALDVPILVIAGWSCPPLLWLWWALLFRSAGHRRHRHHN